MIDFHNTVSNVRGLKRFLEEAIRFFERALDVQKSKGLLREAELMLPVRNLAEFLTLARASSHAV